MSKKELMILTLVCVLCFGFAFISAGDEKKSDKEKATKAGATDEFPLDYDTSGDYFTLMSKMIMGQSPHKEVMIYYSNNLKDLVEKASFTAPVGAVSIKPFSNDGEEGVDGLAVMIKKAPGYDPENGDWHYEVRAPDGTLMEKDGMPMAGKIQMCIGCHAAASATDFLVGTELR